MLANNENKWLLLQSATQKVKTIKAFELLRAEGIEPILIKGFAIERFYPKNLNRISYDIDLVVAPEDFKKAQDIIKFKDATRLNIDLHCGLRHLDTLEWEQLYSNSILIELEYKKIRVLTEEDHLRVLCIHWLTDGGENRKKLFDIKYAICNRSKDFNWDKCLNTVSEKRQLWIISTILLAEKYANLDISDLPPRIKEQELPAWLPTSLERIWKKKHPFIPLDSLKSDPKMFLYQLWHRFPPNPIMATIGVGGRFNTHTRLFYQFEHFIRRFYPSISSNIRGFSYKRGNLEDDTK